MTQYATQPGKAPALSRTWRAVVVYRECGVVTARTEYIVTISKLTGIHTAEVNGVECGVIEAARILTSADELAVIHEIVPFPNSMKRALGLDA